MKPELEHKVYEVVGFKYAPPYTLEVHFNDGTQQLIDFEGVLEGELYGPLQEPSLFAQVRLDHEQGNLVWPNGADFDPEILHDWSKRREAMITAAAKWKQYSPSKGEGSSEGIPAVVKAIHFAVGADRQNKDFDKDTLNRAFKEFATAKELAKITENLSKLNEHLSKSRQGAAKAEDAAVQLFNLVRARLDELSAGSTWMTATVKSLPDHRHLLILRSGKYRKVIAYNNLVLQIVHQYLEPLSDKPTTVGLESMSFALFTLNQEVVWGFNDPREGHSNKQMVEELIKDFLEFLEKQGADTSHG